MRAVINPFMWMDFKLCFMYDKFTYSPFLSIISWCGHFHSELNESTDKLGLNKHMKYF